MRIAVILAASVLVAGCSQAVDEQSRQTDPTMSAPSGTTRTSPTPTSTPKPPPTRAPAPGAPIGEVIRWIEAAPPAAPEGFRTVSREGAATELGGGGVAFTTPAGTSKCVTDRRAEGALTCLVDLREPPARPREVYGEWKGGWVDFPGATLDVGSAHADPGPFSDGFGVELPYGQALNFGDYRCRTDPSGLFCVNYAHQSAARLSDTGVEPFGCLQQVTPPPPDIGARYSC